MNGVKLKINGVKMKKKVAANKKLTRKNICILIIKRVKWLSVYAINTHSHLYWDNHIDCPHNRSI